MIGIDSNIVIRFLTQDDPLQSPIATDLIERRLNSAEPGFISIVAMAEIAWVLQRRYRPSRTALADALEGLLQIEHLIIENEAEVFSAITRVRDGEGAFGDALVGLLGSRAGCRVTLSFDRRAARLNEFQLLDAPLPLN